MRLLNFTISLLLASFLVNGEDVGRVFQFQEVAQLTGILKLETHFGPPGYGDYPATDRVEEACILILPEVVRAIARVHDVGGTKEFVVASQELHVYSLAAK